MKTKSPLLPRGIRSFSLEPLPEIQPPGILPRKFPESQPLSDDGVEAAKKESASTMDAGARSGAGEDPFVESGIPENDPEQPRETEEEKSNP